MSNRLQQIQGQSLNPEQQTYLEGFFAGIAQQGISFGNIEPTPAKPNFDDQTADCERPSRIVPFSATFPSPFTRTLRMPLVRPFAVME